MYREAQNLRGLQPRIEHVVGVSHPGDDLAFDVAALLDVGEQVGQHLTGMVIVGEPIDDRYPRVFGEFSTTLCLKVRIITTSTMRLTTRARSSTGSPREICEVSLVRKMAEPPSWFMPASKLTRVRVEFSRTPSPACGHATGDKARSA